MGEGKRRVRRCPWIVALVISSFPHHCLLLREVLLVHSVAEVDHDAFGVHAECGGDSLGSMVLTRSARRVQRSMRGGAPPDPGHG